MGYGQQGFSRLDKITKRNVRKLAPVWSLSLENDFGEQAQPLIWNGAMYVSDAKWTVAIDAVSGKQLWRTPTDFDADTPRVVCCGVSNNGVALLDAALHQHHPHRRKSTIALLLIVGHEGQAQAGPGELTLPSVTTPVRLVGTR